MLNYSDPVCLWVRADNYKEIKWLIRYLIPLLLQYMIYNLYIQGVEVSIMENLYGFLLTFSIFSHGRIYYIQVYIRDSVHKTAFFFCLVMYYTLGSIEYMIPPVNTYL